MHTIREMFGSKPDIHHVRTFGLLAYVYVPTNPDQPRHYDNAKIRFLLSPKEDHVKYNVYIPAENTRKWALDVDIDESLLFGDRNRCQDYRLDELQFSSDVQAEDTEVMTDPVYHSLRKDDFSTGIEATVMGDTLNDIVSIGEGNNYKDQFTAEKRSHAITLIRNTADKPSDKEHPTPNGFGTADEDDVYRARLHYWE